MVREKASDWRRFAGACLAFVAMVSAAGELERLVDTRHGVVKPDGGEVNGRCLVGPCVPHGSVSPCPDSLYPYGKRTYPSPSSLHPGDPVVGFSQLHAHGTGGHPSYGLFLVTPTTSTSLEERDIASPMTFVETRPSVFRATLDKDRIGVAIAPTRHCALYRFDFPAGERARIVVNAQRKNGNPKGLVSGGLALRTDRRGASGGGRYRDNWNPAEYNAFFACETDVPTVAAGTNAEGTVAWLEFDARRARQVFLKIGVSFRDAETASAHLRDEIPGWDFDALQGKAEAMWEERLGRIRASGFADETARRVFYSNLYHTMLQPRDRTDDFAGWPSGAPVWDDHYTIWDTWRTLYPLFSLTEPDVYAGVVNSFAARLARNGQCCASFIQGEEYRTGQGGDDVDNVIADAWARKVPGIDWTRAWRVLEANAARRTPDYRTRGWVADDVKHDYCWRMRSGSGTIGFAYNDWCVAQVAEGLGKTAEAAQLRARSGNWTNVWNDACVDEKGGFAGFVNGRQKDGSFKVKHWMTKGGPVGPTRACGGFNEDFYEGTCWDYSFTIYHDIPGMMAKMGGRDKFVERLEYALANNLIEFGNEPSFLTIWLFDFAGRIDRASYWADKLRRRFGPWGVPGDDDSGAMGSMYVFLTAGIFPVAGQDLYALHAPGAKRISFRLGNGKQFTIEAPNLGAGQTRIARVLLNGRELKEPFVRQADIMSGGTLLYEMEPCP